MATTQLSKSKDDQEPLSIEKRHFDLPPRYSQEVRDSWWELLKTHHSFYKIGQERKQAVIKFYQCAVVDKKEMTHVGCIDLIKGVLQISRATVYNYLPDEYKRAYSSKQKSKVRHSHQVLFCARCDQQMREGDFNYLCDNCGNAVFM